jgi:hypothetical protein
MKVKRMGIIEILRGIWLFPANKIKSPESVSKQPTLHDFFNNNESFIYSKDNLTENIIQNNCENKISITLYNLL